MRSKHIYLIVGILMLLAAVGFVLYALNHPEASTPFGFNLTAAHMLYTGYIIVMAVCFVLAVRSK